MSKNLFVHCLLIMLQKHFKYHTFFLQLWTHIEKQCQGTNCNEVCCCNTFRQPINPSQIAMCLVVEIVSACIYFGLYMMWCYQEIAFIDLWAFFPSCYSQTWLSSHVLLEIAYKCLLWHLWRGHQPVLEYFLNYRMNCSIFIHF